MSSTLFRRLAANRFLRRVLMLSSGTVLGQAMLVLSAPVLTRLYSPEEFGLFAIFGSLSAMLTTIVNLRYEFAIPINTDDERAAGIVGVATLSALLLSFLTALAVWLAGEPLAAIVDAPGLAELLWLLPVAVLAFGLGSPLAYWSIRQGSFRTNAINRTVYFGTQAFAQIGMGLAGLGSAGLVLGYALGYLSRLLHFLLDLSRGERVLLLGVRLRDLWPLARAHWRYPIFSASSSVLQSACQMLPAVLVAALYGPMIAGWYALSQRVVGLPVRVLSEATSQVFLNEIAGLDGAALRRLFLRTAGIFLLCGTVILLPLALAGPLLFALVFGEPWREAGTLVQLLTPLYLARFVILPISQTLNVLGRLDLHLYSSLLAGTALGLSFAAGWWWQLDELWTIGLFSITSTLAFIVYIGLTWVAVRRNLEAGLATQP